MTTSSTRVLSRSLEIEFEVGSNRRGAVSGAGWLYALPHLGFGRVVCIGAPSAATMATLARSASILEVVDPSARARGRIDAQARRGGWAEVRTVVDGASLADGPSVDLLVVAEGRAGRDVALIAQVMDRQGPGGLAVLPARVAAAAPRSKGQVRATLELALTPTRGEVRAVVPAADLAMRATLRRLGLEGRWVPAGRLAARVVQRLPPLLGGALGSRGNRALVMFGGPADVRAGVPTYIRDIAGDAGWDLTGWGWGVAARGDYDSQKVLVLLRPPSSAEPTGLVKVTRSEGHRARLENEARALDRLTGLPAATGRAPRPWFSGEHAGRVLLGASLIDGVAFTSRARWHPECPHLADAAGWLNELGASTATPVPAGVVADALLSLLDRYARTYRPTSGELAELRERFEAVRGIPEPIPVVFQHGDPGIWNLLIDASGRTVFLDWEAAEPDGLPLWDLLYLVRSYAIATSRRAGVRDRLEAASRHLIDASPLSERIIDLVHGYGQSVGLPTAAVEALMYGCWVHRALKESTRMAPERLADGQFVRLIRRMLAQPDAPTLARLAGSRS